MALPDESKKSPPSPPPTLSGLSDDQLLKNFKQSPTAVARELIKQPFQLDRFWQLLAVYSPKDQALVSAYDKAQNILGKIPPPPQPQPTAAPIPGAPPPLTAEQLVRPEVKGVKRNDIGPQNAKPLEKFLNDFKPAFSAYMKEKRVDAATSSHVFTQHLMGMLAMYRGDLAHFYLTEGAMEMLFSALGPIGNLWRQGYEKNYDLKMKWMKNPLNPNAVYYYLNALPTREAFKILYLPVKATWAILTHGGAPFTTRAIYREFKYDINKGPREEIKQGNFFTPKLKLTQAADILADGLARGISFSPSHDDYALGLERLKVAKLSGDKQQIKNAKKNVRLLLDRASSFSGLRQLPQAILRKGLINTYRRLKRHERDPISYVLSLVAGSVFDLAMTLLVRPFTVLANKLINLIPGVNVLRANLAKFFSSNSWLNTARVGGASASSFVKGVFSPTTFSFGYVGYNLFPNPIARAILTPTFAGIGAFYKTAVNLANRGIYNIHGQLNPVGWVRRYDALVAEENFQALEEGYLKGFKPGPITRFADFLHRNWALRIPINGWVAADLLSPLMQRLYGWSPLTTHIVFIATDYLWQIRKALLEKIGNFITAKEWTFFSKTVINPGWRAFSINNPGSITSWVYEKYLGAFYKDPWNFRFAPMAERPWFKFFNRNVKGWLQNAFNPGFFMGLGISQWLIGAGWNPLAAYIAGPIAGSLLWNGAAFALEKTFGMRIASMGKINAWGWAGYISGTILELIIPGAQPWLPIVGAFTFPVVGMIFSALNISLSSVLASVIAPIYTAITGLTLSTGAFAGWIAGWATAVSITSIAAMTVFFAYTVYTGMWVPIVEELKAGPESANFAISTNCRSSGPNQYRCCSSFSLTSNLFTDVYWLSHVTDFGRADYLSVDLTDPAQTTDAFRDRLELVYVLTVPDWYGGANYSAVVPLPPNDPVVGGDQTTLNTLDTFLPAPTDQKQDLFELMSENSSVVYSLKPFFDILTQLAEEHSQTPHLIAEYQVQLDLMKQQQKLVNDLLPLVEDGNLSRAQEAAKKYLQKNPLEDPCPDESLPCPEEKTGLKQLFESWENIVERYLSTIESYLTQTTPDLNNFLTSLEQEDEGLKQQIDALPDLIRQMEKIEKNLNDEDAAAILSTDFLGFAKMTLAERAAAWDNILKKYFPDVFQDSRKFYFIPQGTDYDFCVDADYSGPPGVPQTVCSTISYTPSLLKLANTGFAKACTTFTP